MNKVEILINAINDDIGREQFTIDTDSDSWYILYIDGEELTQGYDFDIILRLKQIAHENGVYL
jgi:hypothetical protein